MSMDQFAKLKEILTASEDPDKTLKIYKESGVVSPEDAEKLEKELGFAEKIYDLENLKKAILSEIAAYRLEDLEVGEGKYQLLVDTIAEAEAGVGGILEALGLEDQEEMSEEEAEELIDEHCDKLVVEMNEKMELPGSFSFSHDQEGALTLNFNFEEEAIPALKELGVEFGKIEGAYSLTELVAALEETGMHEIAKQLHRIIREN